MAKEPAERAVLCSAEADRQGRVRQVRQVRSGQVRPGQARFSKSGWTGGREGRGGDKKGGMWR